MIVLAADAYLRPGEALSLTPAHVVPSYLDAGRAYKHACLLLHPFALGVASKTGYFDESVVLDHPQRQWLARAVVKLAEQTATGEKLFPYTSDRYLVIWHQAAEHSGLSILQPVPYMLRHAGPSHDILTQQRTLPAVQRRGRWQSTTSVRRYEKASQVSAQLRKLTPVVRKWCKLCEDNLQDIVLQRVSPPACVVAVSS